MESERRSRGKEPATPVAGPYGHPIHPMMVTVPIGAWVASLVFDLLSRWVTYEPAAFARGAFWLIAIGLVGGLVAAVFGTMDLLAVPRGTRAFWTGITHMALNTAVMALFTISILLRRRLGSDQVAPIEVIAISAVSLTLLSASGWLGGKLTYRYGVRVADEHTQAEGFEPMHRERHQEA